MQTNGFRHLTGVLALLVVVAAPALIAQGAEKGTPGYDPAKEITVEGTVQALDTIDCPKGQKGLYLKFQTQAGSVDVHVGPISWLESLDFEIEKGQTLEITGAMGPCGGKEVLKPRMITRGNVTITLRDTTGDPLWSRRWTS
jgi:hypothetical protein